jgi:hypothetical protein
MQGRSRRLRGDLDGDADPIASTLNGLEDLRLAPVLAQRTPRGPYGAGEGLPTDCDIGPQGIQQLRPAERALGVSKEIEEHVQGLGLEFEPSSFAAKRVGLLVEFELAKAITHR